MALTSTRRAIYMIVRKGRQVAPLRIQFLVRNLASTLGFLQFITEDELQEHAHKTIRRTCASSGPKASKLQANDVGMTLRRENPRFYGLLRVVVFVHGTVVHARIYGGDKGTYRMVRRRGEGSGEDMGARGLIGVGSCKRRRGDKGARKKKTLPRSSIYKGGAVTGACEAW